MMTTSSYMKSKLTLLYYFIYSFIKEQTEKWSTSDMTNLSTSDLTINYKIWPHFISAKLVLSKNINKVTKELVLLNYAIQR